MEGGGRAGWGAGWGLCVGGLKDCDNIEKIIDMHLAGRITGLDVLDMSGVKLSSKEREDLHSVIIQKRENRKLAEEPVAMICVARCRAGGRVGGLAVWWAERSVAGLWAGRLGWGWSGGHKLRPTSPPSPKPAPHTAHQPPSTTPLLLIQDSTTCANEEEAKRQQDFAKPLEDSHQAEGGG